MLLWEEIVVEGRPVEYNSKEMEVRRMRLNVARIVFQDAGRGQYPTRLSGNCEGREGVEKK